MPMTITGEKIRLAMLEVARQEWQAIVRSVEEAQRVTRYWDDCGWGSWLREQPGQSAGYVRRQGSGVDWCGIFLAWCGLNVSKGFAGECLPIALHQGIATVILPSTRRITEQERWNDRRVSGLPRLMPLHDVGQVAPGDLITVATTGRFAGGDHWCIVDEVLPGMVMTIEGNASGLLGNNRQGHGVIIRSRPLSSVRRVYRLDERYFRVG
jgi:hypothetical protein